MAKCWERRGCDDAMQANCPHAVDPDEKCPSRCSYGQCYNDTRVSTSDPALLFDPSVDRTVTAKESCNFCAFFLTNGPRIS